MPDLLLKVGAEDQASQVFKKIGGAILDFSKESVKAFAEQEKADRQLDAALTQMGFSAARLGPVMRAQASAFQETLGVSDDMVQQMQALMLRYGTAPRDINSTTQAILDYSAATGTDAEAATQALLRSVERGTNGVKSMGIAYKSTGDKAKDLELAVAAMGDKFGGAAAAQADTLAGRMAILDASVGELQETFGGFIADIEARYKVINTLTEALKGARNALLGDEAAEKFEARQEEWRKQSEVVGNVGEQLKILRREYAAAGETAVNDLGIPVKKMLADQIADMERALEGAKRLRDGISAANIKTSTNALTEGQSDEQRKNQVKASKEAIAAEEKLQREILAVRERVATWGEQWEREVAERRVEATQATADRIIEVETAAATELDEINRAHEESAAEEAAVFRAAQKQSQAREDEDAWTQARAAQEQHLQKMNQAEEDYEAAGMALGTAFAAALGDAIERGLAGEDSPEDIALDTLTGLIPVVLGIIGGVYGNAAGAQAGAAVGGVAASAIRGARKAAKKGAKKYHDGGWADAPDWAIPRFHDGGEIPAYLLPGERVLSHQEIRTMGGPGAVDSAARGGGGMNITISTVDPRGFRDFMTDDGGRGFAQAVRTGRGLLPAALRRR